MFRYLVNGMVATGIHFSVLVFNIRVLELQSAGLANFIAAVFGIISSFIGSRYFVFPDARNDIYAQATKFGAMYCVFAIFHGAVLAMWTDVLQNDYRLGFLLATAMQVVGSYFGNKFLIFKK
jgi:putative flippase GtrA